MRERESSRQQRKRENEIERERESRHQRKRENEIERERELERFIERKRRRL